MTIQAVFSVVGGYKVRDTDSLCTMCRYKFVITEGMFTIRGSVLYAKYTKQSPVFEIS